MQIVEVLQYMLSVQAAPGERFHICWFTKMLQSHKRIYQQKKIGDSPLAAYKLTHEPKKRSHKRVYVRSLRTAQINSTNNQLINGGGIRTPHSNQKQSINAINIKKKQRKPNQPYGKVKYHLRCLLL